ncbi:MAG: hypothetical protein JRF33_09225 [Deltaproteobacteria bacterium]|nr:hypothetical protein [Deltaproteobacteria bacterium]
MAYEKIKEEQARFKEALPDLLEKIGDRWVIFKDGEVKADFNTEDEAIREASGQYDFEDTYLIIQVTPIEATPLTAAVMFGGCIA